MKSERPNSEQAAELVRLLTGISTSIERLYSVERRTANVLSKDRTKARQSGKYRRFRRHVLVYGIAHLGKQLHELLNAKR